MIRGQKVLPETDQSIVAKVATRNYCPKGLIEGQLESVPIAACLFTLDRKGQDVSIKFINLTATSQTGIWGSGRAKHRGGGDHVKYQKLEMTTRHLEDIPLPAHLINLWEGGKEKCEHPQQKKRLKGLLTE